MSEIIRLVLFIVIFALYILGLVKGSSELSYSKYKRKNRRKISSQLINKRGRYEKGR